jgi:hypothetical protein
MIWVQIDVQLDPAVRASGGEEIHNPESVSVVMTRDESEPVPVSEQSFDLLDKTSGFNRASFSVRSRGHGNSSATSALYRFDDRIVHRGVPRTAAAVVTR